MSRTIGRTIGPTIDGLRRLLGAPGLWIGTWIGLVAIAWLVGFVVELVVAAAVGPFDALDPRRLSFGILDVLLERPSAGMAMVAAVLGGGLASSVAWVVLSPVVIARLAERRPLAELGQRALAGLPGVLVQSLWHVLLRAVLVAAVVLSAQPLPTAGIWIAAGLAWLVSGVALDATRVAVVEHGAAPWHPRTAWRGFVRVLKRPALLVPGVALGLAQLAVSGTILWLGLAGMGQTTVAASPWVARVLALLTLGLGLWRIGVVVEDAARSDEG